MEVLTTSKPRLAFTGVGWIGRHRMQAAAESKLAEIVMITDTSENCIGEASKIVNGCRSSSAFDDVLNDTDIDSVVIATPSALHMEQSVQALSHGKAVFCQKPLGRNAEEVRKVIDAAKSADKLLGVDLSYRYTAAFRAIYDVIRSGELGKIFAVDLKFHNAYGPDKSWFYDIEQSGGGSVLDLGVHLIDLMLYALDFPVVSEVSSHLYSKGEPVKGKNMVEDFATATMILEDNINANLACSWNMHAGREAVIEVTFYGTQGGVSMTNINGSFYDFEAKRFWGTKEEVLVTPPDDWGGRALVDWIAKLSHSNSYSTEAEYFLNSAEVIDRIYERD